MSHAEALHPDAPAHGHTGGVWHHATRCGGAVHVSRNVRRPACRCDLDARPPDGVHPACGGSWWECCGKADSEPHRDDCHTRVRDEGVYVCAGDRWAAGPT